MQRSEYVRGVDKLGKVVFQVFAIECVLLDESEDRIREYLETSIFSCKIKYYLLRKYSRKGSIFRVQEALSGVAGESKKVYVRKLNRRV